MVGELDTFVHAPFADEMRGIAANLSLPLADLVVMNLFYEMTVACTSIVCQQERDGVATLIHGRNMDYDVAGLQAITVEVRYLRAGALAYTAVTYAGYVGVLTGVRAGAFSVTVDERDTANSSLWANAAEALLHGGRGLGLHLRELLDSPATTFDSAVADLTTVPLIAPAYVILAGAGPGQGAVVTRERDRAVDVWRLAPPGTWYLVETNYDHWLPDPPGDARRGPAEQRLNATGAAGVTPQGLFSAVLGLFPNLNSMTIYTAVMVPATGTVMCATQNNQPEVAGPQ